MPNLPVNIPVYPIPTHFSDPYNDWMLDPNPCDVLGKAPSELNAHMLWCMFNFWLPVGNFEEMAAYIPRVLELLLQEPQEEGHFHADLLESLIMWCHVEQAAMAREENKAFLEGIQEALMFLFKRWTAEANPTYAEHIEHLLKKGDYISLSDWPPSVPWLRSERFLPHLMALDSIPHAAWLLYTADEDRWACDYSPLPLPPSARLAAMDMVEDWLLTTATKEDIDFWEPFTTRAHAYFLQHPYTPGTP